MGLLTLVLNKNNMFWTHRVAHFFQYVHLFSMRTPKAAFLSDRKSVSPFLTLIFLFQILLKFKIENRKKLYINYVNMSYADQLRMTFNLQTNCLPYLSQIEGRFWEICIYYQDQFSIFYTIFVI